jgi:Protein of unknown function (DUF3800)
MKNDKKLYCYVDETGQDTEGLFFAVSVLVTELEREKLVSILESIENKSGKGAVKWHKSKRKQRMAYVEELSGVQGLLNALYVSMYQNSKEYLIHTADAIAKSLRKKRSKRAIVYIDALKDAEQIKLKRQLRPSVKIPTQVRGIRKDENNACIRLVDAICGLVRDAQEGDEWSKKAVQKLKRKGILETL